MNFQCTFSILLIILSLCNAESKFEKWKNKIPTLAKERMSNNNVYPETLDIPKYPKSNSEIKAQIKQQWAKYYRCLEKDFEKANDNLIYSEIFTPMILEGDSVRMECKTCLSPAESDVSRVTWHIPRSFESPHKSPKINNRHAEGRIFQDPFDASLIILRAKGGYDGDGGLYACYHSGSIKSVHFLHVGGEDEPIIEVKPLTSPKGPHSKGNERDGALIAFTEWANWSPCKGSQYNTDGKCKKVGKRKRFGACKIIYSDTIEDKGEAYTDAINNSNANKSQEISKPIKEDQGLYAKNYLKIFGDKGLPCGSLLLSNYVHTNLTLRENEIESGFCKIKCLESENHMSGTKKTTGVYDKIEDIPQLTTTVERTTLYEIAGTNITLTCPSLQVDEPLAYWQIDKIALNAENLYNKTKGRIFIDIRNRLHINSLHFKDSNIYSCWRNEQLVATIKLRVRKRNYYNFNQYMAIIIMVFTFASILYVYFRVLTKRMKGVNKNNGNYILLK